MNFSNSKLASLSSIPKTIILVINDEEIVFQNFGKQLLESKLELQNKNLLEIFGENNYSLLETILGDENNSISLSWMGFDYEVSFSKLDDSSFFALYLFDITKYSNVENELKKIMHDLVSKKEELQALFDLAANGISILDRNGMFLYANNFFQKMMGYTMEELYHESCISLSSDEYKKPSQTAVAKAIQEGSVVNFRKICVSKSGEHMNASMSLSYLKRTDTILMITSDITDDIKYQEKLKKQVEFEVQKRTQQYEIMCHQSRLAAMGEMIDSIAHQWRQPLNGLGIIVQGLRHFSNLQTINKELLFEIETEIMEKVTYMTQTIDDFSNFFRISKNKESFNLLKNINDAIRLIDAQLKINNVKTKIDIKDNTSLEIIGFPNEFRQVIMNLVHNAMMAILSVEKNDGLIKLDIYNNKNTTIISIKDNGSGIKKEHMDKIFDPYFTTREKGSGIGLYMSKMIIEHHMKGSLSAKNHENGTEFIITLNKEKLK